MFKIVTFLAAIAFASAAPSLLETHTLHTVHSPAVITKTAVVDNSASSAITHQSFTNLVKKVPVVPVVHSTSVTHSAPVVHAAPVIHSAPVVHSAAVVHAAPVIHTTQLLHTAPVITHSYESAPVVHSVSSVHHHH